HSIANNALSLPQKLKPELRNHMFNIVHQCVFTNRRARRFGTSKALRAACFVGTTAKIFNTFSLTV
ncbi:MAG: hypothetical protein ACPIOQ_82670, partial [Promethearchaeia archaeon]